MSPLRRGRLKRGWLLLVGYCCCATGCARVKEVNFTDLAGNECRTTKIHPDVISAETFTACIKDGKAETIPTQHTDKSMFAGAAADPGGGDFSEDVLKEDGIKPVVY